MMTQEEQQAYFEKQRQERLNNCRIKTQEEFIEECRKADIQDSWYAFTEDNSKPVYMNENTVFYGEGGKTIVSYDFQRWDTAFEQLLRYKKSSCGNNQENYIKLTILNGKLMQTFLLLEVGILV